MSKWNPPMRRYQPAAVLCQWCQKPLKATEAGWTHYERMRITDPKWHIALPRNWA